MNCLIRDDDISALTSKADLEKAWKWFLSMEKARLNLGVIPFVSPNEFGSPASKIVPLDTNPELVEYLRERINEHKIEILLHGYSHISDSGKFEFQADDAGVLKRKLVDGRDYLEQLLETKISVFVPPHNSLGKQGLEAIRNSGLNILAAMPFSPMRVGFDLRAFSFFLKRLAFGYRHKKVLRERFVYPFLADFSSHKQLDCFSLVAKEASIDLLLGYYRLAKEKDGIFSLSTHYCEIEGEVLDILQKLVCLISNVPEDRFCLASEIF